MISGTITGLVTRAAELGGDAAFCSFEVTSRHHTREGEASVTVRCRMWGRRSSYLGRHLVLGKRVAVTGALELLVHNGLPALGCRVHEVDFFGGGERERRHRTGDGAEF